VTPFGTDVRNRQPPDKGEFMSNDPNTHLMIGRQIQRGRSGQAARHRLIVEAARSPGGTHGRRRGWSWLVVGRSSDSYERCDVHEPRVATPGHATPSSTVAEHADATRELVRV
jgi:hypothetical protein